MSAALDLDIGGYPFKRVCDIEPRRDDGGVVIAFLRQSRYQNIRGVRLHKYGAGPFCEFKVSSAFIPASGVYAIMAASELKYIGQCVYGLSHRFGSSGYAKIQPRNCFSGGQETNCRINNLIYQTALNNIPIDLWFFETLDYTSVEDKLIRQFKPPWNLR
jgi:hypothetical protein